MLKSKKLALIIDLDQTLIHATIDPSINNHLNDSDNDESLSDIHKFKLNDFGIVNENEMGSYYFIKFRPGLLKFLKTLSNFYEFHVYTMGTRSYALAICSLIDPNGSLFGERILSRDESGSFTQKSLQRLFPTDTSMCVIIDDRSDVWQNSPNLIKVIPFEFFIGIGDINSNKDSNKQHINDRNDNNDNNDDNTNNNNNNDDNNKDDKENNKKLTLDKNFFDNELDRVKSILVEVHSTFYNLKLAGDDPDVKLIISNLKRKVLKGVDLVFSSIIPLDMKLFQSQIYQLANEFGANCHEYLNDNITHIVAAKKGTAKVEQGKKISKSHIVWLEWLLDSISKWEKQDESNYYLDDDCRPLNVIDKSKEDEQSSKLNVDWQSADQELEDFLNESDENENGSENERKRSRSISSNSSTTSINKNKNKKFKSSDFTTDNHLEKDNNDQTLDDDDLLNIMDEIDDLIDKPS